MKKFNFKFKWVLVLGTILLLCNTQLWGTVYKTYSVSDLTYTSATLTYEKTGLSSNDQKLSKGERKVEVPCSSAAGTLYLSGTGNQSARHASIWGSNGTSYDATREISMTSGYGSGIAFTSADIKTENGKYYIIFGASGSDDYKINAFKYVLSSSCSATCSTNATVTAGSNSSVTATSATVSCLSGISSLGSAGCSISSYGFVLGTSANPTISNTKYQVGTTYTTTGNSFSKNLTGLTAGTTYYVRPYATNGNGTAYGTQTSFTTLPTAPTFSPTSGSTVGGSQTITITGHSGSTVYYAWATSSQTADAIYNSGSGSHGTTDAGTASTTVVSGKTLYAISRLTNNSAVASATYTVDATAPTLSSSTPADGATDVPLTPTITWTEGVPGTVYILELSTSSTMSNPDSVLQIRPQWQVPKYLLAGATTYYVRVSATYRETTVTTPVSSFTTAEVIPPVPVFVVPGEEDAVLYSTDVVKVEPVEGVGSLRVQISSSETFPSRTTYSGTIDGGIFETPRLGDIKGAGKLTDGNTYYVRARFAYRTIATGTAVQYTDYTDIRSFVYHEAVTGDVNGDLEVNIADVNAIIDMILSGDMTIAGDVNGDGEVNIADANAIIDIILT